MCLSYSRLLTTHNYIEREELASAVTFRLSPPLAGAHRWQITDVGECQGLLILQEKPDFSDTGSTDLKLRETEIVFLTQNDSSVPVRTASLAWC